MTSVRNYRSMIERLQSSMPPSFSLEKVGEFKTNLRDYPFYKIIHGRGNRKRILISASIHGDEPAGVETIIQLLSNNNFQSDDWEITLLPCLNPYGYEINSRENFHSQDLNRLFKESNPPDDIQLIQSIFDSRFDLSIELHEDIDSPGYYLFQIAQDDFHRQVGPKIIAEVGDVLPINRASEIEGMPSSNGVVNRSANDETMTWWPMALYSAAQQTSLCFTLETPTVMPMQTRVQAHMTAINSALKNFIKEG